MTMRRVPVTLLALMATVVAQSASAADENPDRWQFVAFLDLFIPVTVGGTTVFPPENGSDSIGFKEGAIINNINMLFVGGFEARHDLWGLYIHMLYADIGNGRTSPDVIDIGGQPLPVGATATARLDFHGTFWTIAATFRALNDPVRYMDTLAGVRFLDCTNAISWEVSGSDASVPPPSRSGYRTTKRSGGDGIVGVKGHYGASAGSPWFASYYMDVGTGTSKITWQAGLGIGYALSWGDITAGWRHLDYQFKSDSNLQTFYVDGPDIFLRFRW
jgi:hypothetical protein